MTRLLIALAIVIAARIASANPAPDPAQLFQQGQSAFDQHSYDDAIAAWEESYAISHLPALLYNLAQAYRLRGHAGDCASAHSDYQKFVEAAPPSPERDLAERYITELASCASSPRPVTEPSPRATSTTTPSATAIREGVPAVLERDAHPLRARKAGVGVLGVVGVGLVISGIALGHHAAILGDDITHACSVSCDWSTEQSKDAAGHRDQALGAAFDAIGALAFVGGVALYALGVREHGMTVAPTAHEAGAIVTWSGAW